MLVIGLFPNLKKQSVTMILDKIITFFSEHGVKVLLPEEAAMQTGYPELGRSWLQLRTEISLGLTLGGDGTLLHVTREVARFGIPLCGINMGRLGFLTEIEVADIYDALEKIRRGQYVTEERLMLDAMIVRDGTTRFISSAMNDVVVTKMGVSRMLRLKLFINDEFTANYSADGLIISTSTGSTGYSLSAGGPLVSPDLKVIMMTPICPHSLHSRPLIVSENEIIKIETITAQDAVITVDGQSIYNLLADDQIIIKRSSSMGRFIKLGGRSYYETLRIKLWHGEKDADL